MKTKEYIGIEGVKSITINSLRAKGTLRIYEKVYASLNEMFGKDEANDLRRKFMSNGVFVRELTNQPYKDSDHEEVPGFKETFEVRYLSKDKVEYFKEVIIYDDVVAFYSYGDEPYGVEVTDADFARTQAQIFDVLWAKASRPVIGRGGRSSMI
jgi:hypothetical protein